MLCRKTESLKNFVLTFSLFLFLQSVFFSLSYADPLDNWHFTDTKMYGYPNAVTYGKGLFVAVGNYGSVPILLTSPDGVNWTKRDTSNFSNARTLLGIAYGNGTFVAVGRNAEGTNNLPPLILTSPDGVNWTVRNPGSVEGMLYGIAYGKGTYIAVGASSPSWGSPIIHTSPDGVNWTAMKLGNVMGDLLSIAYGNGVFIAVGLKDPSFSNSSQYLLTSPDGVKWTEINTGISGFLSDIAFGNGNFVAVGMKSILTSQDGVTWTEKESSQGISSRCFTGITYGENSFLSVGSVVDFSGLRLFIYQSDPLSFNTNCAASLNTDLKLHFPIIDYNTEALYFKADASCQQAQDGSIVCKVMGYSEENPANYLNCEYPTLSTDFKGHVPIAFYNNISYWADCESLPSTDGFIWIKLTGYGQN
ncbi:MAG: hypothetical protein OEZ31_03530 [Nitrospirota bacterium]|nr:hypothetical protein [Nitrospirota bacterium]